MDLDALAVKRKAAGCGRRAAGPGGPVSTGPVSDRLGHAGETGRTGTRPELRRASRRRVPRHAPGSHRPPARPPPGDLPPPPPPPRRGVLSVRDLRTWSLPASVGTRLPVPAGPPRNKARESGSPGSPARARALGGRPPERRHRRARPRSTSAGPRHASAPDSFGPSPGPRKGAARSVSPVRGTRRRVIFHRSLGGASSKKRRSPTASEDTGPGGPRARVDGTLLARRRPTFGPRAFPEAAGSRRPVVGRPAPVPQVGGREGVAFALGRPREL